MLRFVMDPLKCSRGSAAAAPQFAHSNLVVVCPSTINPRRRPSQNRAVRLRQQLMDC